MTRARKVALTCAFCGKAESLVPKLILGQGGSAICTECVELCVEIHTEEGIPFRLPPSSGSGSPSSGSGTRSESGSVSESASTDSETPPVDAAQQLAPPMGRLRADWRGEYITDATVKERGDVRDGLAIEGAERCVFCRIFGSEQPHEDSLIVHRGDYSVVILNAYPYTSGHLMVILLRHVAALGELSPEEHDEVWSFVTAAEGTIQRAYRPDGCNVGINLGRAAGAGIPGHMHVHLVPRWNGDTNFMTTIAETRVAPESLATSLKRLAAAWIAPGGVAER